MKVILFVDDLTCGDDNEDEAFLIKRKATETDFPIVEKPCPLHETDDYMTTFAKDHVGTNHKDTQILGVVWNKQNGNTDVDFKKCLEQNGNSKRGMLKAMASVYDPQVIGSSLLLIAKQLYQKICDLKIS